MNLIDNFEDVDYIVCGSEAASVIRRMEGFVEEIRDLRTKDLEALGKLHDVRVVLCNKLDADQLLIVYKKPCDTLRLSLEFFTRMGQ